MVVRAAAASLFALVSFVLALLSYSQIEGASAPVSGYGIDAGTTVAAVGG
jgi:hypothetical protein